MYINWIDLKEYGKYSGGKNKFEFTNNINLIYGKNEAGKSTIFNCFSSLIYGFKPADKEKNLFTNWESGKLEISGGFVFEDMQYEINRRVMSSVFGNLISGNNNLKINNRPISMVENISRSVFESIYFLTIDDMLKIQDSPWNEIEDKLVMNYGVSDLKSPRDVIKDINEMAKSIYKVRGNSQINDLKKEIRELLKKKKEINSDMEKLEDLKSESRIKEKLINDFEEKNRLILKKIDFIEKFRPVLKLIESLKFLEKVIKNFEEKFILKEDFEEKLNILEYKKSIEDRIFDLEIDIEENEKNMLKLNKSLKEFLNNEELIIDDKNIIYKKIKEYEILKGKKRELEIKDSEIKKMENEINIKWREISKKEFVEGDIENILNINSIKISAYCEKIDDIKNQSFSKMDNNGEKVKLKNFIVLFIGILTFGIGIFFKNIIFNYLGLIIFSYASFFIIQKISNLSKNKSNNLEEKLSVIIKNIIKEFKIIEPREDVVMLSPSKFFFEFEKIKNISTSLLKYKENFSSEYLKLKEKEKDIKNFFKKYEILIDSFEISQIYEFLENIKKKEEKNREILSEIRGIKEINKLALKKLELLKSEKESLSNFFKKIGDGEYDKGIEKFKEYLIQNQKKKFVEDEIEKLDSLYEIRKDIENLKVEEKIEILNLNLEILKGDNKKSQSEIEDFRIKCAEIKRDIKNLEEKIDNIYIDELIDIKENEMEEKCENYDRLILIKKVIEIFDQRYREDNQPDILKRASEYINLITGSKYKKIYSDEESKNGIMIRNDKLINNLEDGYSKGTKDQVYTAFKFAIAEKLDEFTERLPIFLDEIFVNWDEERFENFLGIIDKISRDRQIFIFTCHMDFVERISKNLNCNLIKIG